MNIKEISQEIYEVNKSKGFWDDSDWNFGEKIALIHSELSEALEAHRISKYADFKAFDTYSTIEDFPFDYAFKETIKNSVEDELADAVIRIMDLCGKMNIDLERHILLKVNYNKTRPFKHNKEY